MYKKIIILIISLSFVNCHLSYVGKIRKEIEDYSPFAIFDTTQSMCSIFDANEQPIYLLVSEPSCKQVVTTGRFTIDCGDDTFTSPDRSSTNKREKGKSQTLSFKLQSFYSTIKPENKNFLTLKIFQDFVFNTNGMIVDNVKEHLAFFNTKASIENEVLVSPNLDVSLVSSTPDSDSNKGKINYSGFHNHSVSTFGPLLEDSVTIPLDNWSISKTTSTSSSKWVFYQNYPINTLKHSANNFNEWFYEDTYYDKNVHYYIDPIPHHSREKLIFQATSTYKITPRGDFSISTLPPGSICIQTKVSHFAGDLIVGGNVKSHNAYREITYAPPISPLKICF